MKHKKIVKDFLIAFVCLLILNFLLPRLLPGDPVEILLGEQSLFEITDKMHTKMIEDLGLNKHIVIQFFDYIKNLLRLDFGYSYFYNTNVLNLIIKYIPWTMLLVSSGIVLALLIGYILGIESAYNHGKKIDKIILSTMIFN
ncbi:MAG: ABC transporter permease [Peptostreptococcaceae bacterium]|nr:ABC transporter permease [Peptostreptococcaceae bacterium]